MVLDWKAPDSDGGSPITNYVVEYRIEGNLKWIKASAGETVPNTNYKVSLLEPAACSLLESWCKGLRRSHSQCGMQVLELLCIFAGNRTGRTDHVRVPRGS